MPYKAIHNDEAKPPQSVPEKTTVICPDCDDEMHVVKSHERQTGAFVSRHFRHNREEGVGGGGGGGGRSCGESDEHIKLKSIAASKLEHIFEERCWKCELEYTLKNTVTDADHRQADALLLFDDLDDQLGQGVAVEVQYKNKGKNKYAVEQDYIENNISVVWVTPDDFGDHDLRLNEADIRARARDAVWPTHVPRRSEWETSGHTPRKLAFSNSDFNPQAREVSVPATLPEPVLDEIRYRKSDWSALFADYPERHFRLQAAIPRGAVSTADSVTFSKSISDEIRYRESDWPALFADYPEHHYRLQAAIPRVDASTPTSAPVPDEWFDSVLRSIWRSQSWPSLFWEYEATHYINEVRADLSTNDCRATVDYEVLVPKKRLRIWHQKGTRESDTRPERFHVICPGCGDVSGSYSPTMARAGRMCSCGTNFRIDVEKGCAGEVLNAD